MTATILTTATYNFSAYMIYLPIVIALTVFVSKFLFKNSKTFHCFYSVKLDDA